MSQPSMLLAAEGSGAVGEASGWFLENAWLIPVIPAVAFFLILFFGKKLPRGGSEFGIVAMLGSLFVAAGATWQWISSTTSHYDEAGNYEVEPVIREIVWWQSGPYEFGLGQHIDGLAIMALLLVAFISTLVQLYSTEYVNGDRRYTHFFAALTLFSSGMLAMVLAPDMVQLILGWEIMGLCSFMLIGHWWEEQANSRAALKAFFTVRVGDMGLLVGTAMLLAIFGTLQISEINELAAAGEFDSKNMLMWTAVALFIACIGKSGQFPLHTWLPDAMAGPTPVSSLLHSSTMVVAGVFLVARIYPVFHVGLDINAAGQSVNLIAAIGGITLLIAAALAFVQNDIKKVLAYSTVSQLGYMMMGLGIGAWTGAVFHIFTHAFFKCCLFLAAGSISHTAAHHSFDMKKDMGGIWKKMPVTFGAWMVSTAALMGIPFTAGFFSKDEIIDSAKHYEYTWFYYAGIIGAFMTAAYMTRATYLTFFGKPRGAAAHFMGVEHDTTGEVHEHSAHPDEAEHADGHLPDETVDAPLHTADTHGAHDAHDDHGHDDHHDDHATHGRPLPFAPFDSPWKITAPLIILAALAIGAGYLNAPALKIYWFEHQTESSIGLPIDHGDHSDEEEHGDDEEHEEALLGSVDELALGAGAGGGFVAAESGGGDHSYEAPGPFKVPAPPVFTWANAAPGLILVALGILVSWFMSLAVFGRRKNFLSPTVGLTERVKPIGAIHSFLVNKLYLDHLYEKVIVHAIAHPIAKAAYWFNQNVIDGIVNTVGIVTRRLGGWVYRNVDQRVVDGAVNASGKAASEGGHALQPVQSGKVNQYGALLFGAAGIGAILLIILNG
ncbi:MAG: NADH-quinone oxidoreductase subunit L [Ilumatobacter fluminis]|uniref:NADH-quinone oxidoreductase subunit 5 family protein n=1 Tax=Ilumatobacter fluminis TaxID=467091 RepID=UPI0032EC4A30